MRALMSTELTLQETIVKLREEMRRARALALEAKALLASSPATVKPFGGSEILVEKAEVSANGFPA